MFKIEEEDFRENFQNDPIDFSNLLKIPYVDVLGIKNQKLKISCSEYKIGIDIDIKWTKNDNSIEKSLINELNELVFENLKYSDSGRFDCYLKEKRVVQYNLRIHSKNESKPSSDEFDRYNDLIVKIIALICVLITLQMIFNIIYSLCLEKKRIEVLKKSKNFNNLSRFLAISLEILQKKYLSDYDKNEKTTCYNDDSESLEDDVSILNDTQTLT